MPGKSIAHNDLWNLAPRIGIVFDPDGEGRQTLRPPTAAFMTCRTCRRSPRQAQMSPWGNTSTVTNMPQGWDNPWIAVPGGDPIPGAVQRARTPAPRSRLAPTTRPSRSICPPPAPISGTSAISVRSLTTGWCRPTISGTSSTTCGPQSDQPRRVRALARRSANTNQRRVLFPARTPPPVSTYASIQESGSERHVELQRPDAPGPAPACETASRCRGTTRSRDASPIGGIRGRVLHGFRYDSRQSRSRSRQVRQLTGAQPQCVGRLPDSRRPATAASRVR